MMPNLFGQCVNQIGCDDNGENDKDPLERKWTEPTGLYYDIDKERAERWCMKALTSSSHLH